MIKPRGHDRWLGVFAKYWQAGEVKTRLIDRWTATDAAEFHRQCVQTVIRRLRFLGDQRVVAVSPPEAISQFAELAGSGAWRLTVQSSGGLGDRMAAFFQQAFAEGAQRVVLLGTDSPNVPLAYLERAFRQLDRQAVVLGPAEDGGYYLIGAAREVPPVFDGIRWGGGEVYSQTTERLDRQGLSWAALPVWYDIDRPADVTRLAAELVRGTASDADLSSLRDWLRTVG